MINIGVFPSGSEVSIEVSRSLKFSKDIKLIGLASMPDYGDAEFENNISNLPFYTEPDFISSLNELVKINNIKFIIPGMDEVAYFLKINEKEIGCHIVYASIETAEIIRRKSSTYAILKDYIPTPYVHDKNDIKLADHIPIFCKPDIGYGSRGAKKIETIVDLNKAIQEESENYIYTEYLPGEEITVDCFSNNNSELLFAGPRKRERIRMGISVSTRPVELTAEVSAIANLISKRISMVGCWFFQLKKSERGDYKLMEVASRVSGSMATYRLLGVNFILLDIYQRLGQKVRIPKIRNSDVRIERAFDVKLVGKWSFDSVYVDLDDCLILNGAINTDLIAFLYGCRNKFLPIFLITRHAQSLKNTLEKFRISTLFDGILHITDGRPKSELINHKNPLFIDDSFAERQEVSKSINCNVASPDMVTIDILR
jgi:hypothetical protein